MESALRSCSKSAGERKNLEEVEPKGVKMRDFESILHSEGLKSSSNGEDSTNEVDERCQDSCMKSSIRLDLDLNVADFSDSTEHNPFRSSSQSECGSTTGPLEESEPLKRWREMKRNGFITSLYSGIPPLPKPRGRPPKRLKEDERKKKLDAAKREQINRFSKVTSPSGLLSGLNPGIINHVRNSKQVHAIIEAVVRSEKAEEKADSADKKERESKRMELSSNRLFSFKMKGPEKLEHDGLELKLTSENASSLCTEESPANAESVHYLSMKAATVASQWLELLYQDTRGRLAALRRSRKRVRHAIQRELPNLELAETWSSQENNPYFQRSDAGSACLVRTAEHGKSWRNLFNHMDTALSEEGKHLERLLEQVREMQTKCEKGLQFMKEKASLLKEGETLEGEYAVRAAAASLYSACNFILTADNVSCF